MPQKNIFLCFILTALLNGSCKKFIEVGPPPTQIVSSSVFADNNSAISAMIGLYTEMSRSNLNLLNGGMTLYPALSADELYNTISNINTDPFTLNEIPSVNSIVKTNFWTPAYSYIYHANAILEGLENSPVTDSVKGQLRGEAKFIRALCYFYLVNLFGDVPLVLTTDYRVNATLGRTSSSVIYSQIVQDLNDAKALIKVNYPSAGRMRPNKWTVASLLSRVYLYQKQWQKAEAEASEIINSGMYSLAAISAALSTSNEVIWQFGRETSNTAEGITFIPSSAMVKPAYALTDSLLNAFETGDQRKSNWIKFNTISGVNYYYPYKYRVGNSTTVTERLMMFRLGEQYLIRAEARIEQNNIPGALSDLNTIRNRAGLPSLNISTLDLLKNAIQKERRIELFAEWGHRWSDLKRWNLADAIMSAHNPAYWQPTDVLYPIPLSEIESNPSLTQNPGYQ